MAAIESALALQAAVREGNTAAALRLASELQDMAPDDDNARFLVAATKLAAHDIDGATAILRELPNDPRALMLLGKLARTQAERLAYMGRALELAPDDPDARTQVELAHKFSEQAMGAAAA